MTAVTIYDKVAGSFTPSGQAWVLAQGAVSRTGLVVPLTERRLLLLAVALIAVTFAVVRRRDA
jgi:hypothetical protein